MLMVPAMDGIRFKESCDKTIHEARLRNGIGTLSEKTLHAVLKRYFNDDESCHEIKVNSFIADIYNESGIIEIQTRQFNKLRKKLECFLPVAPVTVVYPVAKTKWLMWIDETTGEVTGRRKSPKTGTPYDVFFELYKIKMFLKDPNLKLCIVLLEMEEYRILNGWSADKKKGSTRYERIPIGMIDEIHIDTISQYQQLLPENLPAKFTAKDFKKAARLSQSCAQTALNVLHHVNAVERVGKIGNQYVYEKAAISKNKTENKNRIKIKKMK